MKNNPMLFEWPLKGFVGKKSFVIYLKVRWLQDQRFGHRANSAESSFHRRRCRHGRRRRHLGPKGRGRRRR
jgi:hypothetical protein